MKCNRCGGELFQEITQKIYPYKKFLMCSSCLNLTKSKCEVNNNG